MAFDLNKDKEIRRAMDAEDRLERQREYNRRQKRFAKMIGENFAAFGLLAVMVLMIGSIWTEVSIFTSWRRFVGEAFTTAILYVLADIYATSLGVRGGKLDDDYINNHEEYLSLRETVRKAGIVLMDAFCDWQIDVEYEYYIRKRCKDLKIDYKEYKAKYEGKTLEELEGLFPLESIKDKNAKGRVYSTIRNVKTSDKAAKVFALNQIKHIELTPDILMTDGRVRNDRGNVPESGEEHVDNHTTSAPHIIKTVLFAIAAALPAIELVREFSIGMLIYTIFKIALMLYRMYSGYSEGAKAFNSVEISHISAKTKYLYLYLEYLDKKIYLELADRYDIVGVVKENPVITPDGDIVE